MKQSIAVLGANGVYARHLIPRLIAEGFDVRAVVRRPEAANAARAAGARVDGVHLGQGDGSVLRARTALGPDALIGLSTHDAAQVVLAGDEPVDYLGFGPVHATATKGYARGLGSEAVWIASQATHLPVFPIGGIDARNAGELEDVGRAAVGAALLAADDPPRAARELRALLSGEG